MNYASTRQNSEKATAAQAILTGLAPDGGLYIPEELPVINFEELMGKSYNEVALAVLKPFLPEYDEAFLKQAIAGSYEEPFGGKAGQLVQVSEGLFSLELWHGPTSAFKDYALQLMPRLLVQARKMLGETAETIILVATSGDTGKAALEGYKNLEGIKIAVFYPSDGTSEIQRLQMATQAGNNVAVFAIKGNFDDAQRGVKIAFGSKQLAAQLLQQNKRLSSANSINWGRLVPQIVYYVTTYLQLCVQGAIQYGQPVDYCVPTGNFGDILAGYYAKAMGLPVGKLICASNSNNVLAEFLQTGRYNAKREFYKTSSPSMDILVSSNLERLLYHTASNPGLVKTWMEQLAENGEYTVDEETLARIQSVFAAGWANEEEVSREIQEVFTAHGYLCDPHTAVAFRVCGQQPKQQAAARVVLSTASPFKFSGKVLAALGQPVPENEFEALAALENCSGQKAPRALAELSGRPVRFTRQILPEEILEIPKTL